jgi:purine-nucleoside/S-methyl-5'-thioadenosine phosphorylase / adenosine deaminase
MTAAAPDSLAARLAAAGLDWIVPDWPAPRRVRALSTTRNSDATRAFDRSRQGAPVDAAGMELRRWLPADPVWLAQVHGATICDADAVSVQLPRPLPQADGAIAHRVDTVCIVRTADCLPVLFTDRDGSAIAAAHAGWRGLAAGVLEAALAAMRADPADVVVWMGPAIGPRVYEVGVDVLNAHCATDPGAAACFAAHRPGKWLADLYALARRRLTRAGVRAIHGGGRCTFSESALFHSYRRDGAAAGRMATLIWIAAI